MPDVVLFEAFARRNANLLARIEQEAHSSIEQPMLNMHTREVLRVFVQNSSFWPDWGDSELS